MNYAALLTIFLSTIIIPVKSRQPEPIKIGLLVQDKASTAARQGAELAVKIANEKRVGTNPRFQVITKDMEGPWGTGSKQAVDLIFENQVWALLGSHDGRNAHLVEQAATKSTVVFLSAWSSDPSLSQAFVPWFFNCVPNDRQQAHELIGEIYNNRKFNKVVTIADKAYDSNQSLKSFLQEIKLSGKKEPLNLVYDNSNGISYILSEKIIKAGADCIVLFCQPATSLKIVRLFRQKKLDYPVFGSLSILNENLLSEQEFYEFDNRISVPCGMWNSTKYRAFRQEYRKIYGKNPGMVAAYSFDGMNMIMEAIRLSGSSELEKIQQTLSKIHFEGVTGPIYFDNKGNRQGKFNVLKIINGIPGSLSPD